VFVLALGKILLLLLLLCRWDVKEAINKHYNFH
jgi:hypothetical protein